MVCIYCGNNTRVVNSRSQKRLNQVWRRRQCESCKNVFTSLEVADLSSSLRVRYSNTVLKPFHRDQLMISMFEVCKHRTTATTDAGPLAQTIISILLNTTQNGIVDREAIVTTAYAVLERFDATAAALYKAYHRQI